MDYKDLRDFIAYLEKNGKLVRISQEVDPHLEMTEICDRTLRAKGPALLFENPKGSDVPVLANLFGTPERVALGMGEDSVDSLREVGKTLAQLKEPDVPKGFKDAWDKLPVFKQVLNMAPKVVNKAPCQQNIIDDVDLSKLPIQTCWPEDAGPLITWALVVTKGTRKERQNLGIYRQQVIAKNKVIIVPSMNSSDVHSSAKYVLLKSSIRKDLGGVNAMILSLSNTTDRKIPISVIISLHK